MPTNKQTKKTTPKQAGAGVKKATAARKPATRMAGAVTRKTATRHPPAAAKKTTTAKRASANGAGSTRATVKTPRAFSNGSSGSLVVVESPTKARTISRILGDRYTVRASMGHVRDLPRKEMGLDLEHNFEPDYHVLPDKRKVVEELRLLGNKASNIFLATDPDREGEAISWHLVEAAGWKNRPVQRVVFHEITPGAVQEAFQHPRGIDAHLVDAQQARRVLDRLVGYQLSPLLWRKVQTGLSAGRVQSVAVRLVVDREREIVAFVPQEYWSIEARLKKRAGNREEFTASLFSRLGEKGKIEVKSEAEARRILDDLRGAAYQVADVRQREVRQSPTAPFITSTLQQEAGRKLRFTARKTMTVAQQLYEGVTLGNLGATGLITYMRTDSTNVSPVAIDEVRRHIVERYGRDYLPASARLYTKKSKGAQEAHEAIRPTGVARDPESVRQYLTSDQFRLYQMVWQRFIASQMADAISDATSVDVDAGRKYLFRATGSVLRFPGFRMVYMESMDDAEAEEDMNKGALPQLSTGEALDLLKLDPNQHFTQPPPRYTEASLIKALEERGIGRPSTYAPIISTIQDRGYVERAEGRLRPTTLGTVVTDLLVEYFPNVLNYDFTAEMENELDSVASGELEWVPVVRQFYGPFEERLASAHDQMPRRKVEEPTDEKCDLCGRPMVVKTGRFGKFVACTGFPECKNTKPALKKTGVECPECGGDLVERRGKQRGRIFYGCSNFPTCNFMVTSFPMRTPCPECSGLLVRTGRGQARCTRCAFQGEVSDEKVPA